MKSANIIAIMVLVLVLAGNASADLVAYYRCEGNANDSAGTNDGIEVGNPTYETGWYDQAINLDGIDDYVDCGNSAAFNMTDEITVAAWVNIDTIPALWTAVVTKGNSAWRLSTWTDERTFVFAVTAGEWIQGTIDIPVGEWHHLCGTYDGTNIRLYVDGIEDPCSPTTYSGSIATNSYNVCIGRNAESGANYWDGLMDEVRIYNHALDANEIAILVNPLCSNQIVSMGTLVTLDAGRCSDVNDTNDLLNFSWEQTEGPIVALMDSDTARPSFMAPEMVCSLTFEVTVTKMVEEDQQYTDILVVTVVEDANRAVFVSSALGHDENQGTFDYPVATLERAFGLAYGLYPYGDVSDIYLHEGEYDPNITLVVLDGMSLYGGFQAEKYGQTVGGWRRSIYPASLPDGSKPAITLQHPTAILGMQTAIEVLDVNIPTVIDGLIIRSADGGDGLGRDGAGENSIGLYVHNCTSELWIVNNQILAGRGGDGVAGVDGVPGPDGADGSAGVAPLMYGGEPGINLWGMNGGRGGDGGYAGLGMSAANFILQVHEYCNEKDDEDACFYEKLEKGKTIRGQDGSAGQPRIGRGGPGGGVDIDYFNFVTGPLSFVPWAGWICPPGFDMAIEGLDADRTMPVPGEGREGASGQGGFGAGEEISLHRETKHWVGSPGIDGQDGNHGQGGSGGGGGGGGFELDIWCGIPDITVYIGGPGGGGGGGGHGGGGGTGGTGGGGSFGLFLSDSFPTAFGNFISTAGGGKGGDGGLAGPGGVGGSGGQGLAPSGSDGGSGYNGGRGQPAGDGGRGGGGGGGRSCGVYVAGISIAAPYDPNRCDWEIGWGGPGGAPNGEQGIRDYICPPPELLLPFPFILDVPFRDTVVYSGNIPLGSGYAFFMSSWANSDSDVEMTLICPSGRVIDSNTSDPNVVHAVGSTFESYTIKDPEPNEWTIQLYGRDVPPQGQEVILSLASMPMNAVPVANAGPDQFVECTDANGTIVTLDGSGSSDPDCCDSISFEWKNSSGHVLGKGPQIHPALPLGINTITLTVDDGKGGSSSDEMLVTIQDTNAPFIILNDPSEHFLVRGMHTYSEQGATAVDTCCGSIPVIVGGDTVDATTAGTYVVTYEATDSSGNTAFLTRTVEVIGLELPEEALKSVDDLVETSISQFSYDANTQVSSGEITITNISQTKIGSPLLFVPGEITPAEVSLVQGDGMLSDGHRYLYLSALLGNLNLDPNETITDRIYFFNPEGVTFTFEPSVLGVRGGAQLSLPKFGLFELAGFVEYWLTDESHLDIFPAGGDGIVNFYDLAFLEGLSFLMKKAHSPIPTDGAENVGLDDNDGMLSWSVGATAVWQHAYFGTSESIMAYIGKLDVTQTTITPTREPATTYYWRIDQEESDDNIVIGDVWSFTTAPLICFDPIPVDGATDVDIMDQLSWSGGWDSSNGFDVYFGTDENAVTDATPGSPLCVSKNQMYTSYDPGLLLNGTVYFWRIDNTDKSMVTYKGKTWSFTTLP